MLSPGVSLKLGSWFMADNAEMEGRPGSIWNHRIVRFLVPTLVLGITLLPILRAQLPPGADLAVHLARVFALNNLAHDADLSRFYSLNWEIYPNLAFDLLVWPLVQIVPLYMAGKIFVISSLLMMVAGVALIRRHYYGRVGYIPLLAVLVAYSAPVAIGLTNYYFGIGLAVLGTALWLQSENWLWHRRLFAMGVFSLVLFFSHLLVFCLFGLTLVLLRGQAFYKNRNMDLKKDGVLAGQFVIPAVLLTLIPSPTHGTETVFGPMIARLEAIVSPVLYFNNFDVVAGLCLIFLILWLALTRRLTIVSPMKFTVLFFIGLGLVMPVAILGIWLTHVRIPLLASLLLLATMKIDLPERGMRYLLVAVCLVIGLLKLEKVDRLIAACDIKKIDFIRSLDGMPRGARILPVIEDSAVTGDCLAGGYWHIPALAVIEKSVFYPQMFVTKWPIELKPDYRQFSQKKPRPVSPGVLRGNIEAIGEAKWNRAIAEKWRSEFDYLVWLHPGTKPQRLPENIREIKSGSFYTFYAIDRATR